MIRSFCRHVFQSIPKTIRLAKRKTSMGLNYDLSQEIIITPCANVLLVGINLPDEGNKLNDSALKTLKECFTDFNTNDKYSVAVLHGIGGNLCKGLQKSASIEAAEEVIKVFSLLKKPVIASVTGYTVHFGFQLAVMCDIRIIETTAIIGLGLKNEKSDILPIVRERLIAIAGVAAALDVVLTGVGYNYAEAALLGLINKHVECGSGLGKCLNSAKGIAKYPLEDIIKERSKILSCVSKNRTS